MLLHAPVLTVHLVQAWNPGVYSGLNVIVKMMTSTAFASTCNFTFAFFEMTLFALCTIPKAIGNNAIKWEIQHTRWKINLCVCINFTRGRECSINTCLVFDCLFLLARDPIWKKISNHHAWKPVPGKTNGLRKKGEWNSISKTLLGTTRQHHAVIHSIQPGKNACLQFRIGWTDLAEILQARLFCKKKVPVS